MRSLLKLWLLVGGVALAVPAQAQHQGHNMPGMTMPAKPAAKKPAAKKPAAKKAVAKKAPVKKSASAKAAAKKPAAQKPVRKKTAAPAQAADPHAGHDMSNMPGMEMPPADDMSNMPADNDMPAMPGMPMPAASSDEEAAGTNLSAGNASAPPVPTADAADEVYGSATMAMGRHHLNEFHGGQKLGQILVNIAEYQARRGGDGFEWDAQAWYGGDINRLWLKSEGEGEFGRGPERAEVQALYSHAIDPYFNLQGGLRYDFKPDPSRVYATIGIEGLAPSFFDLEGTLFLSNRGELLARAEGTYDQRITQRLIVQPRAEINFAAQSTRAIGVGAGLSDIEIGARLRYDIRREFAPYVGVQYERTFGKTRNFRREDGDDGGWSAVAGVRLWF